MNSQQKQFYNVSSVQSVHNRYVVQQKILDHQKESGTLDDKKQSNITSSEQNNVKSSKQSSDVEVSRSRRKQMLDVSSKEEEKISSTSQNIQEDYCQDEYYDENVYNNYSSSYNYGGSLGTQVTIDGVEYDIYGNQAGEQYDLGKDGAFNDFSILSGVFYNQVASAWRTNVGAALQKKGFREDMTTSEQQFIEKLKQKEHDVAIIISDSGFRDIKLIPEFKKAVLQFHNDQRGLFIFGDNDPYYAHANQILPDICKTQMIGNNPGGKLMRFGDEPKQRGYFDENSMIFAGINSLFEGITICFPDKIQDLTVLATGTDGKPCICQKDRTDVGGRVVIDTGFTKLYCNWDSAGQARYIINACVYLVDVQGRFGGEEPTIATRPTEQNPEMQLIMQQVKQKFQEEDLKNQKSEPQYDTDAERNLKTQVEYTNSKKQEQDQNCLIF